MPAIFVHVSDIHFGQEKGERVHIHTDVKDQLILDAAEVVRELSESGAHGILVTGDITQAGKREQFEQAGEWLDRLAKSVGCEIFRIQMVPGNHDLDRDKLSKSGKHLLELIKQGGSDDFEQILADTTDRSALFARFDAYGRFCEGYDCPLDTEGRYSTNLHVELAPGRAIRFVRLNSALLCTGAETEEEPELVVGARQFPIPRKEGEENIVLIHHPLHWFKDSEHASSYLHSRARVIISGHEHNPRVTVDQVEDGCDLMMLAAGATVPFKSDETYTFTYNVIVFDWDAEQDALSVTLHPRAWNPKRTCFEADAKRLGGSSPRFVLGSPNFQKSGRGSDARVTPGQGTVQTTELQHHPVQSANVEPVIEVVAAEGADEGFVMPPEIGGYRLVLLQFFRDLTAGERLHILVELDALPSDSDEAVTQAIERQLFDWLVREGRIAEVEQRINQIIANRMERSV